MIGRIRSYLTRNRPKAGPETREQFWMRKWRYWASRAGVKFERGDEQFSCWRLFPEYGATDAQRRAVLLANGIHKRLVNWGRALTDDRMNYPDTAHQDDSESARERFGRRSRTGRHHYDRR